MKNEYDVGSPNYSNSYSVRKGIVRKAPQPQSHKEKEDEKHNQNSIDVIKA